MAATDPTPAVPPVFESEGAPRAHSARRRGMLKPRAWEVRMAISIPAVFALLAISAGLADYLVLQNLTGKLEALGGPGPADATVTAMRNVGAAGLEHSLVVLVVSAGLAVVGGAGLAFSILSPLREIIDATATVARGKPQPSLNIRAGFELGELGRSFNSMVDFVNSMIDQREALLNDDSLPASLSVDAEGRITSASAGCLEILGATREKTVGRTIGEVRERNPGLAPPLLDFCQECVASLAPARDLSPNASSFSAIVPDKPVEIDLHASGRTPRTISVSCGLLRDVRNLPNGILFLFRDAAQLRSLHELFSRTDQLAALGTFTMGLSHELRNPLGALKGAAQLLRERIAGREDARPYLERISREVDRVDRLVRELFDFSSAPMAAEGAHDLGAIARQALEQAERGLDGPLREGKRIVEEYAADLPRVVVQEVRVVQAVVNVVINAFEHMPANGGVLTLRTGVLTSSPTGPVVLDVANTGSAVAPDDLERIFEPFFSTRRGGTGLGLSIAYQIVLQNHGQLVVTNLPDGVCFRFVFRKVEVRESEPKYRG